MYTIELDCPPGWPRPDDLLPGVLEGTGFEPGDLKNTGRLFGNWTWEIPEKRSEEYVGIRETVKERVTALYNRGAIRYGSW